MKKQQIAAEGQYYWHSTSKIKSFAPAGQYYRPSTSQIKMFAPAGQYYRPSTSKIKIDKNRHLISDKFEHLIRQAFTNTGRLTNRFGFGYIGFVIRSHIDPYCGGILQYELPNSRVSVRGIYFCPSNLVQI